MFKAYLNIIVNAVNINLLDCLQIQQSHKIPGGPVIFYIQLNVLRHIMEFKICFSTQ